MTKVYNKPCGRPSDMNMKNIMIDIFRFEHMKMARIPETLFIPIFSRHIRIKMSIKNYKYWGVVMNVDVYINKNI